jgi:hypothetical protein
MIPGRSPSVTMGFFINKVLAILPIIGETAYGRWNISFLLYNSILPAGGAAVEDE